MCESVPDWKEGEKEQLAFRADPVRRAHNVSGMLHYETGGSPIFKEAQLLHVVRSVLAGLIFLLRRNPLLQRTPRSRSRRGE